ncbi:STAS domain-containing protein [Streptomyces sp. CA-256286]|uniref:STAS domain-containing protein n=1 Tax=Streptomyces sp. CA-256286 TaxID=2801033 RepID=UPI001A9886F7|nr:STAS domain-containing protein [Streptomyces sp. CA-256286]QTA36705.1 anti-sigma factor antagonist [Streptomyces sp. CA-256286]
MTAATYRLDEDHQVIEVREVIDHADRPAIQDELSWLIRCCTGRTVIIDLHTPLHTVATVNLLISLRHTADRHGLTLCVTARHPHAMRILRLTGMHIFLRATATLHGARAIAAACAPRPHSDRPAPQLPRQNRRTTPPDPLEKAP